MSGGGGDTTTVQSSDPWGGLQPYLSDIYTQGQAQYGAGPAEYYPGTAVAPLSDQTVQGLGLTEQRALGGAGYQQAASDYITNLLSQGQLDTGALYSSAMGAADSIGSAQQYLNAAGQPLDYGAATDMAGLDLFGGDMSGVYSQQLADLMGYGTLGEASQFAGDPVSGAMPTSQQLATQMMTTPGAGAVDPAATSQLTATAEGEYLLDNPYLADLYESASLGVTEDFENTVLPAIAAQFGAAGRTGSGAQALTYSGAAGELANQLSGLAADIYAPAYEAERDRQLTAATDLGELGLGGGALQLGAGELGVGAFSAENLAGLGRDQLASDLYLGERGLAQQAATAGTQYETAQNQLLANQYQLAADIYGEEMARQLQAGGLLGDLGLGGLSAAGDLYSTQGSQALAGASLAPSLQGMDYTDLAQLLTTGGVYQDQAQNEINAAMAQWDFEQQAEAAALQEYASLLYGLGGNYGTTETQTESGGDPVSGILGGALMGGSMGGPMGAAGGAALGVAPYLFNL